MMLCRSVSPPFFLGTGLGLFHPGPTIPCSTCLHGNRWVRACPLSHATFPSQHGVTGCGGLLLFLCDCLSLTRVDLQSPRRRGSCQVQTQVELAFPGYNSMVVATWLDPPCKLTQSLEFDAGEGLELMLHVGHVLEWLLFFDSLPLLLALPKIVEELGLQLIPLLLLAGGVVVVVVGPEDVVQVLPPPCTPVVSEVPQRVSREAFLAPPGCGEGFPWVEAEGILRGAPMGHTPSCRGFGLAVFLMEDLSHAPLEWLAGRLSSSWPRVACLPHTLVSRLPVGAGLVAEESKVTSNPDMLVGGCTTC